LTELEERCIEKVAAAKSLSPEAVSLDTTLDSLELDSLDRVTLSFEFEDEYGVVVSEDDLLKIHTVADVVVAVREALQKKQEAAVAKEWIA
jgi:acyl carrier protein